MGKVCVFLAEGFEEVEALTVVDLLRRAGIDTDMVSVTGIKEVVSSHRVTVTADCLFDEVDFGSVDMLALPGGMPGTKNLEAFQPLMDRLDEFQRQNRFISAVCAAPSILGHRGYLKGRKACSFPDFEGHLEGAEVTRNPAETAGNIITGRGMGCAVPFGLAIVERLKGREAAIALADKIVYTPAGN